MSSNINNDSKFIFFVEEIMEGDKLTRPNEIAMSSTTAKQYLEEIYEHNTFRLEDTKNTRKFALKKGQLKEFVTSSQRFNLQPIEQEQKEEDAPIKPQPEVENIPTLVLEKIPTLKLNNISVHEQQYNRDDGINRLDKETQNLIHDSDEFENNLACLVNTLQSVETATTNCEHYAKLNKVMSAAALRQLNQIHDIHSNSNFMTFVWNKILDWIL